MCNTLVDEPEDSSSRRNKKLSVGSCYMQGWCNLLMNAHTYLISLHEDPNASFFGIYDGHGGDAVSKYASRYLHKHIVQRPEYKRNDIEMALKQAFLDIDEEMKQQRFVAEQVLAGSTALVILIKDDILYCANVGNCRAIASVHGDKVLLSAEPKPMEDSPNLYRTLGDYALKRSNHNPMRELFTAHPNVQSIAVDKSMEFIVMACNGIWSIMSDMEMLHYCRTHIARGLDPQTICDQLLNHCFASESKAARWSDNLTIIMICFLHGEPYSQLIRHCKSATEV